MVATRRGPAKPAGPFWRQRGFIAFILVVSLNATLDLGHKILIQNTLFKSYEGAEQVLLTAVVNGLILLPFVLLFTPAGFLADRFAKPRVMQAAALAAVGLTLLITLCYYQGWFVPAFALTFLLATQSALYSPAKYGFIRELAGTDNLSAANGWVQAATIISMLIAIVLFSALFEYRLALTPGQESRPEAVLEQAAPLGWLLVALSAVQWLLARRLPAGAAHPQQRLEMGPYLRGELLRRNLRRVTGHRPIFWSVMGLALFWSISQVMVAVYPAFVEARLGEINTFYIQGALAQTGIGILLGSILVARLSRHHINTGLIPAGTLLLALGLTLLPGAPSLWQAGALFFLIGIGGAMMVVPLNALIQFHAAPEHSGAVLAGNNLLQNVAMLLCLIATVLSALAQVAPGGLLLVLAATAVLAALVALIQLPEAFLRLLVRVLLQRRYRLEILGFEHLPADGQGTLLLGNHVSWLDWAMVQMACPRHVHFVMERSIYERWYLKWLLDRYRVIPISAGRSREAMAQVASLLRAGEVVCLFPEGAISHSGQLGLFRRGYERLASLPELASVRIVPFYLRGLWGSRFSRSTARMQSARRAGWKRDVVLAFGAPLPLTARAPQVKQAVSLLSIHAWEACAGRFETLARAFIATARRAPSEWAVTELKGAPLSHLRLLSGCLMLARRLPCTQGERVGVLLPTTVGGVVGLMALLMRGCTLVPLNYTAAPEVLIQVCERAGLKTLITSRRFLARLAQRGVDLAPLRDRCELIELESLREQIGRTEALLTLMLARLLPVWLLKRCWAGERDIDATAAILFSSGSEGEPKGVKLSHRNIMANLKQISDVFNIRQDDRVMGVLPPFHAFGLTATTLMPLIEGVPLICHPDPTDAVNIGRAVARWRATLLCGSSTFLGLYARHPRVHPLMFASLRLVVAGAERLTPEVRELFEGRFHKQILEGYGCTETTPVASVNLPDHLDTRYWSVQVGHKPGSVGMALPGSWFQVVDPDTLAPLPIGQAGMVLIGGSQIMQGYLEDDERTRAVIIERDGLRWYITGDKGYLDEDGFLTLIDRYARFAKIGGEMVSLGAVEAQVRRILGPNLPLLVTSIPDPHKGEQIVLLIEAESVTGVAQQLRQAGLAPLWQPARMYALAQLPRLGGGKPDLQRARQWALDLSGRDST